METLYGHFAQSAIVPPDLPLTELLGHIERIEAQLPEDQPWLEECLALVYGVNVSAIAQLRRQYREVA